MATLIKADGTQVKGIKGAGEDGKFTLEQLQEAVGGYIEGVPGTKHRAWCNEEGLLLKLPRNHWASQLFRQELVGNVLVMEDDDRQD